MGGDRSFHGMFTCVLKFLQCFKELKEKITRIRREVYGENKDRNIKKNIFVFFEIYLKQSEKERKLMAADY